jgi:hypothetical protein
MAHLQAATRDLPRLRGFLRTCPVLVTTPFKGFNMTNLFLLLGQFA